MTKLDKIQKEVIATLIRQPHGVLDLSPRTGKTRIIIEFLKKTAILNKPYKTLWVTPSAQLVQVDLPNEFIKWGAEHLLPHVKFITWASLKKMNAVCDLIVFDEVQFITPLAVSSITTGRLKSTFKIAMTGTLSKHDDKNIWFEQWKMPLLYSYSIEEAVDDSVLSDYDVTIVDTEMSEEKLIEITKYRHTYKVSEYEIYNELTKKIENNEPSVVSPAILRHNAMKTFPSKVKVLATLRDLFVNERSIFFTGSIKIANDLFKDTAYHSQISKKKREIVLDNFQSYKTNHLALVNSGGVGFTFKDIDNLVVMQVDSDNNGNTTQKLCRTLLAQTDYKAKIWLIRLINTADEKWVTSALSQFDAKKIKVINYKTLINNGAEYKSRNQTSIREGDN